MASTSEGGAAEDLNLAFGVLVETKKFYATPSPLRAEKSLHSSTTCLTSEAYSILGIPIQYSDPQSRSTYSMGSRQLS